MPSEPGSPEPCPECRSVYRHKMDCTVGRNSPPTLAELREAMSHGLYGGNAAVDLTDEEADCIADGEPYCFRCGKPASSFPEYESQADEYGAASNYVVREEGTYNPETNRFACDACYIAIGMPVGEAFDAYGWRAP